MKKRFIMFFVVLTLLIATTCMLTACTGGRIYNSGDSIVDTEDVEIQIDPDGKETITRPARLIKAQYLLPDGCYITLEGNKVNEMVITGAVGDITEFKLADIEQNVKVEGESISVNAIDYMAFTGNQTLKNVDLSKFNQSLDFTVGMGAFAYCPSLTNVKLPTNVYSSINYIEERAFLGNKNLTTVENLEKFTNIGEAAFADNPVLDNITLSTKTKFLHNCVFQNCAKLENITINDSIQYIGDSCFDGSAIKAVDFTKLTQLKHIGYDAFKGNKLTSINIPDNVTVIGNGAFLNNPLTSVNIPFAGQRQMYNNGYGNLVVHPWDFSSTYAFTYEEEYDEEGELIEPTYTPIDVTIRNAYNIDDITFTNSQIKSISINMMKPVDEYKVTYAGVQSDDSETIKDDILLLQEVPMGDIKAEDIVVNVANNAFKDCTLLDSVNIPNALSIGDDAFSGDIALKDISGVLTDGVKSVGYEAFMDTIVEDVVIPASVTSMSSRVFYNCGNIKSFTINEFANVLLDEEDTVIGIGEDKYRYLGYYLGADMVTDVENPDYIEGESDPMDEFIPDPEYMFYNAGEYNIPLSLTKVVVKGMNNIPEKFISGFKTVTDLTVEYLENAEHNVNYFAFVNVPLTDITPFVVDGTTYINDSAFAGTKVTDVVIPASVDHLGSHVFSNCAELKSFTIDEYTKKITNIDPITEEEVVTYLDKFENIGYYLGAEPVEMVENPEYIEGESDPMDEFIPDPEYKFYKAGTDLVPLSLTKIVVKGMNNVPDGFINGFKTVTDLTIEYITNAEHNVGESAFCNVPLSDITPFVVKGTKKIDRRAFMGTNVVNIVIPSTVINMDSEVFYNCANVASFTIEKYSASVTDDMNVTTLQDRFRNIATYFGADDDEGIPNPKYDYFNEEPKTIPDPEYKFYYANGYYVPLSLTKVVVKSMNNVPYYFMKDMKNVTDVEISYINNADRIINSYAFDGTALTDIDKLIANAYDINSYAFANTKIAAVTIPYGKTYGSYVFDDCMNLRTITVDSTSTALDSDKFYSSNIYEQIATVNITSNYKVDIPANYFDNMKSLTNVIINNTVGINSIGANAFRNCKLMPGYNDNLFIFNNWLINVKFPDRNVVLPDTIVGIADNAIQSNVSVYTTKTDEELNKIANIDSIRSKLVKVDTTKEEIITDGVIDYLFVKKDATVPDSIDHAKVLSINTNEAIVYVPASIKVGGVDVPVDTIMAKSDYKYIDNKKEIVVLPASITLVESGAFRSSTLVYYTGTPEQFIALTGDKSGIINDDLTKKYTVNVFVNGSDKAIEMKDVVFFDYNFPEGSTHNKITYGDPATTLTDLPFRFTGDNTNPIKVNVSYKEPSLEVNTYNFDYDKDNDLYIATNNDDTISRGSITLTANYADYIILLDADIVTAYSDNFTIKVYNQYDGLVSNICNKTYFSNPYSNTFNINLSEGQHVVIEYVNNENDFDLLEYCNVQIKAERNMYA